MKSKFRKAIASACVGLSLGATAIVFMAPATAGGEVRYGYCNHADNPNHARGVAESHANGPKAC